MKRLQHFSAQINAVTAAARAQRSKFKPHLPRLFPLLQASKTLAPYSEWELYLSHGVFAQDALHPVRNTNQTFHQPSKMHQLKVYVSSVFMACKLPNISQMQVLWSLPARVPCASPALPSPLAVL